MADILDAAQTGKNNPPATDQSVAPTIPLADTPTTTSAPPIIPTTNKPTGESDKLPELEKLPEPKIPEITPTAPASALTPSDEGPPSPVTDQFPAPPPLVVETIDSTAPANVPVDPPLADGPNQPPVNVQEPPAEKKPKIPKGVIISAIVLILLAVLPVTVFFVSQQQKQVAELRSRAALEVTCESDSNNYCELRQVCLGNGDIIVSGTGCGPGLICCRGAQAPTLTPTPIPVPTGNDCESNGFSCVPENWQCGGAQRVSWPCGQSGYKCMDDPDNVCHAPGTTPSPTKPAITTSPRSTATVTPSQCSSFWGKTCKPGDPDSCGGAACRTQNWACTIDPVSGNNVCNQHGPDLCPGSSCTAISAYKCPNGFGSECHQNLSPNHGMSWADAIVYADGCGQVDQVCAGGPNQYLGCGDFEVIKTNCLTPTSPPIGGQCNTIHVYNAAGVDITQALINGTANVQRGETLTLAVAGSNATKGRFRVNGGTFQETTQKNNKNEFILPFVIPIQAITNTFTIEAEVYTGNQWR